MLVMCLRAFGFEGATLLKSYGRKNTAAAHRIKLQFTAKILWLKKYTFPLLNN